MSSARPWRSYVIGAGLVLLTAAACGSKNDSKKSPGAGYGTDENGASSGEGNSRAGSSANGGHAGQGEGGAGAADTVGAGAGAGAAETSGGDGSNVTGAGSGAGGDAAPGGAGATGGGNEGSTVTTIAGDGVGQTGALTFTVTTPQSLAIPQQAMLWTITVGNTSSVAVQGVNVLMRMPKGLQLSNTLAYPPSSYCGNGICTEAEEATWDLGDLAPGMTQTIQVDAVVGANVGEGDSIAPLVRLNATGLDPATVTKSVPVHASNAVELTVAASADPLVAGDTVELAVDLGNIGDVTLFTGELSLVLPGALEVLDVSDGGEASSADGLAQVNWSLASLPVGATSRRFVQAKLRSGVKGGAILNPHVTFNYEAAPNDTVAEYPISVVSKAPPLLLLVEPVADPVVPNGDLLYDVTISNTSLRAVDGINLWLRVPPEFSYYSTSTEPDSSYCGNGTCSNQELGTWVIGTLAAGTSQTVTVNANVLAASAGDGTLASTAFEVRAVGVNPLHVFNTVAVHAKPSAQLLLGTAFAPVTLGQTFSYDVDVGQVGAGSLVDAELTLELPPDVTVGTISDAGSESGGIVTWSLGDVAVNGGAHRSVEVTVGSGTTAGSVLAARANLRFSGGQEVDAVSDLATSVVAETLPLTVTVNASANPAKLGDAFDYTTTIKNTSNKTVDGVQLLLRLPAATAFAYTLADPDSSYCGNGTCSGDEEAVWDLGSIAAGATKSVLIPPNPATTLAAGSLLTFRQRLTAVDLGGVIQVTTTLATKK